MTDLGRMHNMHDRDDLLAEQVCSFIHDLILYAV